MSLTRVVESRAYDTFYDPVYTGPYNNPVSDPRVVAAVSSSGVVSGSSRPKYFKRPIMPRINAVPPHLLLAPTAKEDTIIQVEEEPEPSVKNAEVQTVYRESEAQTVPYTPAYFLQEGVEPEILMLQGLTFANGLPVGPKEIEMIENARAKRDLESSLPPFTDETCLVLRKKLMEYSELKEYHLREKEIDSKREGRLLKLRRALEERDENNEFLVSQRLEALRQNRMDDREKNIQKLRKKRVKILRRLAKKRNQADPMLSTSLKSDIIEDYYDHGSSKYAPLKRNGRDAPHKSTKYDVNNRTAPLTSMGDISNLESTVPNKLLDSNPEATIRAFSPLREMSKTAPAFTQQQQQTIGPRIRAAEPRLTSASLRVLRNTKRDIETMSFILSKHKRERPGSVNNITTAGTTTPLALPEDMMTADRRDISASAKSTFKSRNRTQGRPTTPDFSQIDENPPETNNRLHLACVLLQRLIRGRAVQNSMYEGRYRRSELIEELRNVDSLGARVFAEESRKMMEDHMEAIKTTTVNIIAGSVVSNSLTLLAGEQHRLDVFADLAKRADQARTERLKREAVEAGRRQRDGMKAPATVRPGGAFSQGRGGGAIGALGPAALEVESAVLRRMISDFDTDNLHDDDEDGEEGDGDRGERPPPTPPALMALLHAAAAEQTSVDNVLDDLDAYPSLVEYFKHAINRKHQEQISSDLVIALHSTGSMEEAYQRMDEEDRAALVQEVLQRLLEHTGMSLLD